ncbi:GyrI-like domain-containing protein [Brevibacillus migulae]|uniref:GyrI-like domain-containing protein n=1 Tax=Brevibacillus migulae TaxID=1644114 RepID=UPI00106E5500|nr:GyrI-like domain-containing protein [Brevibacillus migulae]
MELITINKDSLNLIGISARTTNQQESSGQGSIPALWGAFFSEQITGKIPEIVHPHWMYTLYSHYENGAAGEYTVLIGHESEKRDGIPAGLARVELPAAKYAVITTRQGPVSEVVPEAWMQIWEWSATGKLRRTFSGDFERYDARSFDPQQAVVEIFIAVE